MSDKNLPLEKLLKILVAACPTLGFLFFAPTTMPITAARVFTASLRNEFHALSLTSNFFCSIKSVSFEKKLSSPER